MSIFGVIKSDDVVFTGDKLRIDATESFLAPGLTFATISHEISLDSGVTWYNISVKKYVDWIFSSAGDKVIQIRLSTTQPVSQVFTKTVTVKDLTAQSLFSKDSDLYRFEAEINQLLPKRWSGWNLVHLQAQEWIMDWLDEKRIFNKLGQKFVVADLMDTQQVKQLSIYKTLEFIYESNINITDDLYTQKRNKYRELANEKASRSQLQLDFNQDGEAAISERTDLMSVAVYRR